MPTPNAPDIVEKDKEGPLEESTDDSADEGNVTEEEGSKYTSTEELSMRLLLKAKRGRTYRAKMLECLKINLQKERRDSHSVMEKYREVLKCLY